MRNKDPTLIKMGGCSHELDGVVDSPQLTTVISFIINNAVCLGLPVKPVQCVFLT